MPGVVAGDAGYLAAKYDELKRAMGEIGRDPTGFRVIGQVHVADEASFAAAREAGHAFVRAGATDVVVGVRAEDGPSAVTRGPRGRRAAARGPC